MLVEVVAFVAFVLALVALSVATYCWMRIQDADFLTAMRRLWREDAADDNTEGDDA